MCGEKTLKEFKSGFVENVESPVQLFNALIDKYQDKIVEIQPTDTSSRYSIQIFDYN